MEPEEELQKLSKDYRPNRATRRRKPKKFRWHILDYVIVPENILTKPSHKYKKMRRKNVTESSKERAFRTREVSKKDTEEVS